MKITRITLDKKSLIWSDGIPFRALNIEDCANLLRQKGSDQVEVSFKTMDEYREKDRSKFTHRLLKICKESGYSGSQGWFFTTKWSRLLGKIQ